MENNVKFRQTYMKSNIQAISSSPKNKSSFKNIIKVSVAKWAESKHESRGQTISRNNIVSNLQSANSLP